MAVEALPLVGHGNAYRQRGIAVLGPTREFRTGGLGFTLHRTRHVVLIERPWTPGDAEQAEDRCHRIGMAGSLLCHWLQLGVADRLVDGLIASKAERIALLLGRGQQELRRRDIPYELIGSRSFFDRREVKDVMAFLRLLVEPDDDLALSRIAKGKQ